MSIAILDILIIGSISAFIVGLALVLARKEERERTANTKAVDFLRRAS